MEATSGISPPLRVSRGGLGKHRRALVVALLLGALGHVSVGLAAGREISGGTHLRVYAQHRAQVSTIYRGKINEAKGRDTSSTTGGTFNGAESMALNLPYIPRGFPAPVPRRLLTHQRKTLPQISRNYAPKAISRTSPSQANEMPMASGGGGVRAGEEDILEISGFVNRITYSSKDDFKVIKVKTVGARRSQQVALVGTMPGVSVGQTLNFKGYWSTHPRHGKRFTVVGWNERTPDSEGDMVVYLQGMIKGVGPVTAKNIVKTFGVETFRTLDGESALAMLKRVKGIGPKTAVRIKSNWDKGRESRDALQFLQKIGLSVRVAQRVVLRFGQNTEKIVRDDPYTALSDVRDGGFMEAERVALTLNSSLELPSRYMAAVQYVLSSAAEQDGHSFLPVSRVVEGTSWLLGRSNTKTADPAALRIRVRDAIKSLQLSGTIMLRKEGSNHILHPKSTGSDFFEDPTIRCQSKDMSEAELAVKANLLARSTLTPLDIDAERLQSWLDRYQAQTSLKMNEDQLNGVKVITNSRVSILTGGPGSGKTITAQALVALWTAMGKKVKLCAPTGRAAQRLSEVAHAEAQTIHRLLEFEQKSEGLSVDELEVGEANGRFARNRNNPIEADVVLLDESSMLDLKLAAALFDAIPITSQVVLVGDADQLPPVGPGSVFADAIKSEVFRTIKLHHIYRQSEDSNIVTSAHNVNVGQLPQLERLDGRSLIDEASSKENTTYVSIAEQINTDCLWVDIHESEITTAVQVVVKRLLPAMGCDSQSELQVLSPVHQGQSGTISLNRKLQQLLNPPSRYKQELSRGQTVFRVGDRVIQTENNYDSQVFNGDMGYVTAVDAKSKKLTVRFPPLARIINSTRKMNSRYHDVIYQGVSLRELEPAWAITVHKAQGSEYPIVIIPIAFAFRPLLNKRLLYTALSRAKTTAILVGPQAAIASAVREVGETRLTDLDTQWRQAFSEYKFPPGIPGVPGFGSREAVVVENNADGELDGFSREIPGIPGIGGDSVNEEEESVMVDVVPTTTADEKT